MLQSGGVLVKGADMVLWSGDTTQWGNWSASMELSLRWASYAQIYREQLWVAVLVNKLARAQSRLPLPVYERKPNDGRERIRDHPYAELLRNPHPRLTAAELWKWKTSTQKIYGEAIWLKERDPGGRPIALHPVHPTVVQTEERNGRIVYEVRTTKVHLTDIDQSDVVHFREFNPESTVRGLSPLEPLRRSLENEDAARRATAAFWRNGGRPSVVLSHPTVLSEPAQKRLKMNWEEIHGGADNFGKVAVLEEGMKPEILSLNQEDAQYIETRKLHREEACAIYDVPPPVVHILDHATFSNITEQMRSIYRDTMAPLLADDEAVLEKQLRSSVRKGATEPDFGEDVYAEFLLDEVLRGAFEDRAAAIQAGVNSGVLTPNEARTLDNRPPLPGGDQLYVNSTMVPIQMAGTPDPSESVAVSDQMRTLMGRLSRAKSLDEVNGEALVAGLNGSTSSVLEQLAEARRAGEDVATFRARLQAIGRS